MASSAILASIQNCVTNPLAASVVADGYIAGVIGDAPSHYSKSPNLWNAAFHHTHIDAVYLPLDVPDERVGELLSILKDCDRFLGFNVTVPHKVRVMDYLDELDIGARRIQAVNTVVRMADGRLVGHNTDGEGFVESLFAPQPDRVESFIGSLKNMDVILLGAGGSARAVAFHVSDLLEGGRLLICNRTSAHAEALASDVNRGGGGNAEAILESKLFNYVPRVGLIVNSTTKGQGGLRKLDQNRVTVLEAYSALAPANPPVFPDFEYAKPTFQTKWLQAASADIEANHTASMRLAKSIPQQAGFYDLIYYPEETVFLRHGRETGHATMNGKAMIVNQAVLAFRRVCHSELAARGINTPDMHREILEVMYRAW